VWHPFALLRLMTVAETTRKRGGESAGRLIRLLLEFTEQEPLQTVAQLAECTGFPQSTVYRYIGLLKASGLVDEAERGVYRLTERVFALAAAARMAQGSLVDIAHPFLEELRDVTGETVFLVRRSGFRAFCLDRVESHRAVRLSTAPGADMVLSSGSAGKVLLSAFTRSDLARFREHMGRSVASAGRRIPSDDELDAIRTDGYAESDGEIDQGVWGVSAPVLQDGRVVAALGVAGPGYRIDGLERQHIRSAVMSVAARLTDALTPRAEDALTQRTI